MDSAKGKLMAQTLATASLVSTMTGGPYSGMDIPKIPNSVLKARYAGRVVCSVCGGGDKTLYKNGNGYICKDCRKGVERDG